MTSITTSTGEEGATVALPTGAATNTLSRAHAHQGRAAAETTRVHGPRRCAAGFRARKLMSLAACGFPCVGAARRRDHARYHSNAAASNAKRSGAIVSSATASRVAAVSWLRATSRSIRSCSGRRGPISQVTASTRSFTGMLRLIRFGGIGRT